MYNKLFTKILDSSIWLESHPTRIVWMTFIAVMDEDGMCQFASVANLARRAIVTLEEARHAVSVLESPDLDSSDPDHGGKRIERVPGGWIVLNSAKYREQVTREETRRKTRERVARFREKQRDVTRELLQNGECNVDVTQAVAVAVAVVETKKQRPPASGFELPDWIDSKVWADFEEMRKKERHPLTDGARKILVRKLDGMRVNYAPTELLEAATLNGWRSVYEPKSNGHFTAPDPKKPDNTLTLIRERNAKAEAEVARAN